MVTGFFRFLELFPEMIFNLYISFPHKALMLIAGLFLLVRPGYAEVTLATEWDLTPLVPDRAAWEAAYGPLLEQAQAMAVFQERISDGSEVLLEFLSSRDDLRQRMARLSGWASLQRSVDSRDPELQALATRGWMLFSELGRATSWFSPWVQEQGGDYVAEALERHPDLAPWTRELTRIIRATPHTLSEETERALSIMSPVGGAASSINNTFLNADFQWPELTISTGETVNLSRTLFPQYRQLPVRADRRAVFATFWQSLQDFERTLGDIYFNNVRAAVYGSQVRGHPSALAASLFWVGIPESIYYRLIDEVHASLP